MDRTPGGLIGVCNPHQNKDLSPCRGTRPTLDNLGSLLGPQLGDLGPDLGLTGFEPV